MGVNPAFQKIHHVEGSANDLTVFTQYASIGYRNGRVFSERAHNAVFPLHHVSRRQRLSRGLLPQYITPVAGIQQKGGIGLPALKLLHVHLVTEVRQCLLKPVEQAGFIRSEEHTSELQSRPHLVCRLLLEKKKNICTT